MRSHRGFLGAWLAIVAIAACAGETRTVVHGSSTAPVAGPEPGLSPNTGIVVGRSETVPPGTEIWIELAHSISVDRDRVGDRFQAHVSQELRSEYGQVLLPLGAPVVGTIVDLRPAYGNQPAAIGLRIDSISMAGVRQPLAATIVRSEIPGVRRVRGQDVLIGAAAGAILGGVLEGGKGALVGGALGAGGGALISLGRGSQARERLPQGTDLALRLDQPVRSLAALRGRPY